LGQAAQRFHLAIKRQGVGDVLHQGICKPVYLEEPLIHVHRAFFKKTSFAELLTSKGRGLEAVAHAHLDSLYRELKEARDAYLDIMAKARVHAYVRILQELQNEIHTLSEREGLIVGGGWHSLIKGYLHSGLVSGAYAFTKLGVKVRHFLIDEFQDTSRLQWEALLPLLEESLATGGSLFYVGDVKQAIYGWRGGDRRLFEEVAERFFPSVSPQARQGETLTVNYRSSPAIVNFNNGLYCLLADQQCARMIAAMILGEKAQGWAQDLLAQSICRNFEGVKQQVAPHLQRGRERGQVEVFSLTAPGDELRQAVRERFVPQVKEVWKRRGRGIAVLVRRNQDAEDIAAWLMAENIPVVTENSLRLRNSTLIKGLVAFLRFLDYPLDDLAFWGAAASRLFQGLPGLPLADLEAFLSEGQWQPPLYKAFERRFPEITEGFIRPLLARVGFVTPYDLTREVVERFYLADRYAEEQVFINRFFELIFQTETQGQRSLAHFLQFWEERELEEKIGLPDEISAVRVLTVHKAKGLEFPVVFIPFTHWRVKPPRVATLDDGGLVNLKRPLSSRLEAKRIELMIDDALEILNLLYVATTRSEEELYLYETCLPLPRGEGIDRTYLSAWLRELLKQKGNDTV
jgi:ATP-dependent helicase/nuclease subunit A